MRDKAVLVETTILVDYLRGSITIHVEWDFTTACLAPRQCAGISLSPP